MEKEKVSWINFSEDAKARYYYDIRQRPDLKRLHSILKDALMSWRWVGWFGCDVGWFGSGRAIRSQISPLSTKSALSCLN